VFLVFRGRLIRKVIVDPLLLISFAVSDRVPDSQEFAPAIGRLPEKDRQLIVWRLREDFAFAEIAKRLGITEHAAQQDWMRIRDRLNMGLR
jgi:DNA-directed RNA polymerase specialized sigma24 family protein